MPAALHRREPSGGLGVLNYRELIERTRTAPVSADEDYKARLREQRKIVRVDEHTDLERLDPRAEFIELPDGRIVRIGMR
jgi:hypothetical protein